MSLVQTNNELKNENIIYFCSDEWGGDLKTSQYHIAVRFAQNNKVLHVNSIGLRRPTASKGDIVKVFSKIKKWVKGIRKVKENLFVFTPIVVPFHDSKIAQKINRFLLIAYIKYYQRRLKMQRPIIVTFLPNVVDILDNFKEKKVIYYCADQMASFKGAPSSIAEMEKRLLKRSDVVITTSRCLYNEKKLLNDKTYYIPHGVDVGVFEKALLKETVVPSDIKTIRKPIIGFFGLVCLEWIDFDLLTYMAGAHPGWSIVLIGKVAEDVPNLAQYKNIFLLGPREYTGLPAYCKGFDVGIIPFKLTELVKNVNPLKLKEYLAAGLGVVSTRIPEVEQFSDFVRIADNYGEFVSYVEDIIKNDTPELKNKRNRFMKNETWESKFETITGILVGNALPNREFAQV